MLPPKVHELAGLLARLPGVGEKTALRYALFVASGRDELAQALAAALGDLPGIIVPCARCGHLAEREAAGAPRCAICRDRKRDAGQLCVVARIQDLLSIERSGAYRGHYFVLGALLSPLEGVGADELPLAELSLRVRDPEAPVREVVLATPPSVDGEATALLVARELEPLVRGGLRVTRLASGIPHGGDLEFADPVTIGRALAGRRHLEDG
jgi:recombination protein RecR